MKERYSVSNGCLDTVVRQTQLEQCLTPLLGYLDEAQPGTAACWERWRVTPAGGGANNRVYRVTSDTHDLAIKFTIADSRDRAGREYQTLTALREAGLSIAPQPILLDRSSWSQPVVVQTWLPGTVDDSPPRDDREWAALIEHLLLVHSVTPARVAVKMPEAVHTACSAREALRLVEDQIECIPLEERSAETQLLLETILNQQFPEWAAPAVSLSRCDPAMHNFVKQPGCWYSVDWENSGWGDPAFEVAGLTTHPSYAEVEEQRWDWVIARYCSGRDDPECELRIRTYRGISLAWWVGRFERMLYEVPRRLDERLAPRPTTWLDETRSQYERYLALASAEF